MEGQVKNPDEQLGWMDPASRVQDPDLQFQLKVLAGGNEKNLHLRSPA